MRAVMRWCKINGGIFLCKWFHRLLVVSREGRRVWSAVSCGSEHQALRTRIEITQYRKGTRRAASEIISSTALIRTQQWDRFDQLRQSTTQAALMRRNALAIE